VSRTIRAWSVLAPAGLALAVAAVCAHQGAPPTVPPLGATPTQAGTTFRVWAPFADTVSVKVNDGQPLALTREDEQAKPEDLIWRGDVPGARAGDRYQYLIRANGSTAAFADPRARRLTGSDRGASGVIVDPRPVPSLGREPDFSRLVLYELHVGTFNVPPSRQTGTFADAIARLDYLKDLGVNAVEIMPVHENARNDGHTPPSYNWGYDPVQLYAVNSSYGTPEDFKKLVRACHDRNLAVVLDVVYNHLVPDRNLLLRFGGVSGPGFKDGVYFYGDGREDTGFGPRPDYGRRQVRAYIDDNALMWLREYGCDGLRWDSTVNIRAYHDGADAIADGGQLLQKANDDYRTTEPRQPGKIAIAEDLKGDATVTTPTNQGGFGFNSQWDDSLWGALRKAVFAANDADRDLGAVKGAVEKKIGADAFARVIYTENHDKVGHPQDLVDGKPQVRLPALIDGDHPEGYYAKKRSTLAAAVVLTSPGIPMLFQGQEMLETRTFDFGKATPVDWDRVNRFPGIVALYRDLIALRRNTAGKTEGLTAANVNVFHKDDDKKVLAYHRYGKGGAGDDVVVVVNLSYRDYHPVNLGFPRGGKWVVRFNSGAAAYDPEFKNGDSPDTVAQAGAKDGLGFNADVGIGPYSVVILSQD
jgi:1,4-alpha-glucan branching enzyme